MVQGLSVSRIVNVQVNLQPQGAAARAFNRLLIAGDSDVVNGLERIRSYDDLAAVANDFGTTAPEYLAAELYFEQAPQPAIPLQIGRWLRTASSGLLNGGVLTATEQQITNFNNITNGGFNVAIDGIVQNLTALNFSATTNLNGVAGVITAALSGATCSWNGSQFVITSATTGAGVKASGTITLDTNVAAADTLTLAGVAITFVASGATGSQVNIGVDNVATTANLLTFLQASTDPDISDCTYSRVGNVITATFKTIGVAGNSFTMTESSTHITLSGATLAGGAAASAVGYATAGSGTDIATLLKLTSALAQNPVPGFDAETPLEAAVALYDADSIWYALTFAASIQPTDDQDIAVAGFIQATSGTISRIFGVTITNTNVLDAGTTSDLASRLKVLEYTRSITQYAENPYAIAAMFGDMFSVNFLANNSTITVMFKQEVGIVPAILTATQANTLRAKRCNVFALYGDSNAEVLTAILQYGVTAGPAFIDEIWGLDWFQNALQIAIFNLLYSSRKIPQTDAGANQLVNTAAGVCQAAVNNGFVAPGQWNADGFGQLQRGDTLKTGFYIYIQPMALQDESTRSQRIAPPMQIALKLAGAIQEVQIIVNVNR